MSLTPLDIALAAALLIANGAISWGFRLGLEKSIAIAAVRMLVQLALIGIVLKFIFVQTSPAWTFAFALVMIVAAGVEVVTRQHRGFAGWRTFALSAPRRCCSSARSSRCSASAPSSRPIRGIRRAICCRSSAWSLGNTMTAVALVLDGLNEAARRERASIEARLALGAPRFEALAAPLRTALRTGMMPMLNAMATTGLVTLPGMMTGQIIAGADPVGAAKYQMLIMFLIAGATALGSFSPPSAASCC